MLEIIEHGPVKQLRMSRIVDGKPVYFTNAYFIDGLLIDTGCQSCAAEFRDAVQNMKINLVVNTHHHEDHIGNNDYFEARHIPIYAPSDSLERLKNPPRWMHPYRVLAWGYPPGSTAQALVPEINTANHLFQVVPAPGHCDDQVVLWEPKEGWLFSADAFMGIRVRYLRADEDPEIILHTVRKLAELPVNTIYCSLLGEVQKGRAVLQEKADFLEQTIERVKSLAAAGLTDAEISLEILGEEGFFKDFTDGHFCKENLVSNILAGEPREPWTKSW